MVQIPEIVTDTQVNEPDTEEMPAKRLRGASGTASNQNLPGADSSGNVGSGSRGSANTSNEPGAHPGNADFGLLPFNPSPHPRGHDPTPYAGLDDDARTNIESCNFGIRDLMRRCSIRTATDMRIHACVKHYWNP